MSAVSVDSAASLVSAVSVLVVSVAAVSAGADVSVVSFFAPQAGHRDEHQRGKQQSDHSSHSVLLLNVGSR